MYADEGKAAAVQLVRSPVAYYKSLAVQVRALLTDTGSAFRPKDFAQTCIEMNITHRFTRPSWRSDSIRCRVTVTGFL
jgi:transposase InsO family protein